MPDATARAPRSPAATTASYAKPTFEAAGGPNLRVIIFALVVLVPVALLGYVYWQATVSGGVRELPDGYKSVDLRQMVSFPFDDRTGTTDDVPELYRSLDGQKVQ
ncbi:MAG: hypothetical protein AAGK78_10515, partial [Planctomycetota bacterium]